MTMNSNGAPPSIDSLLATLRQRPDDPAVLTALAERYLDAATSDDERAAIRATTATTPAIYSAYERLYRVDTRETDPLRYFVLSLAMIAMTDGQPSPRDSLAALRDLKRFARGHGIDPQPYFVEVESIAGERAARLFAASGGRRARPLRYLLLSLALIASPLVVGALLALLPPGTVPVETLALAMLVIVVPAQLFVLYRFYDRGRV
jgi:hypothetical protein